ncbi:nucleotidyltransferase domain-containing protein [Chengkuizengella axinellae]|uniref:Uncharacterized protein n=1 Tax=Chengkuizengella axinellae TaxID=3064388 RepID=A0ABT9J1M7_9BACL|nr:hypothetical protein [Chengkuizengella sp. 2205SS18-9]MDP5275478.1 hypothetical protein [Chengkuizengella sp. 2205SS18-9]
MKIYTKDCGEETLFIAENISDDYKQVMESQFYSLQNGSYIKKYPSHLIHLKQIRNNYEKYAEEMFKQMGYFKKVFWKEAISNFIHMVDGHDIDWWLTGSCALCLRGIEVMPHDVDIILHAKDIEKINSIFHDYIVEPIVSMDDWVVDYFGVMFLNARIDLAFDPKKFVDVPVPADFGPFAMEHLEEIDFNGHVIKIPPLHLQYEVNKRRGRHDRVKAIKAHMQNNKTNISI